MQRADDIRIAVRYILSDPSNAAVKACGTCNPGCDDLTCFICMGYTNVDIDKWIASNSETLKLERQKSFDNMLADYVNACYESSEQARSKDMYSQREHSANHGCSECIDEECKYACNKIIKEGD